MFDSLSTRLQGILDRLGGRGRLTPENIQEALREVRVALLEADVNFKVVRTFIDRVRERAVGQDVLTSLTTGQQPLGSCRAAREEAAARGLTPLILDTAGRLHIDETMLEEVRVIRAEVKPHHVLLVVDAMTGQDALTVAEKFNAAVGIDAVVLSKLDGDARGGAALSVRAVTGRPIAFVGVGEKTDALEPFHPDRLAQRILGMGDVLSLVEKAQATVEAAQAEALAKKIRADTFSLEDFATQLRQLRSMGPLGQLLDMVPFFKGKAMPKELDGEEKDLLKFEAMIGSMTPDERREPHIINGSRRLRIARGSGTRASDGNRLLKQYAQLKKMMKRLKQMEGRMGKMKGVLPFPPR